MDKRLIVKRGCDQHNLTGVSPLHGSHAALPIACDAFNARTVAVREYHYIFCAVVARKLLNLLPGAVLVARLSRRGKENPAGIASWRTRRMARRKRDVSDLPYAAPPLSCAAFFVKVQKALMCRTYGKGNIGSGFTSKLEVQDSPYQP